MHVQFSGRYRLQVFRGDTDILLKDTGWFSNLITNNGMNLLAGSAIAGQGHVGSGSAVPAVTDTQLGTLLSTGGGGEDSSGRQADVEPYYTWNKRVYTFGIGAVQGVVREVGVGPSPTNLFSRALLTDINGSPTTLTLGALDRLKLTYELRTYIDISDHSYSIDIGGVTTTSVVRPSNVNTAWIGDLNRGIMPSPPYLAAYTGGTSPYIGTILSIPSGTPHYYTGAVYDYVPGTYFRDWYGLIPYGTAQTYTAISLSGYGTGGSYMCGAWQFSLEPAVVKGVYQDFRIEGRVSWSRYP